jgi:hypothetical protein
MKRKSELRRCLSHHENEFRKPLRDIALTAFERRGQQLSRPLRYAIIKK